MSATTDPLPDLQRKRSQLLVQVGSFNELRPGTLVQRYRKCGKASCWCSAQDERGHGPCWSLTFPVKGKSITRVIPAGAEVAPPEQRGAASQHKTSTLAVRREKPGDRKLATPRDFTSGRLFSASAQRRRLVSASWDARNHRVGYRVLAIAGARWKMHTSNGSM